MPEPILISCFSYKGGVGKTTGCYNIAAVLAKEFKLRVLLIDGDSQGNLTSIVMHKKFRELARNYMPKMSDEERAELTLAEQASEEAEWGEDYFYGQESDGQKRKTVYSCIKTQSNQFNRFAREDEIRRRVDSNEDGIVLQHIEKYGDLYFLPGDIRIQTFEEPLSRALTLATLPDFSSFATYPRSVTRLFIEIAKKNNIDVIIVDLNPAPTTWNRCIVMGSDYFMISNLPDYFSRRAVESIANLIPDWNEKMKPFRSETLVEQPVFRMPAMPKLLGYICNRVKIRRNPREEYPAPIFTQRRKIRQIHDAVNSKLLQIRDIGTENLVMENNQILPPPLIKEFDRSGTEALESGIPMAYINFDELEIEDKRSVRKGEVTAAQKYYLNAYYTAIIQIFRGLSDEHHAQLNDRLRAVQNLNEEPPLFNVGYVPSTEQRPRRFRAQSNCRRIPISRRSDFLLLNARLGEQRANFREISNDGGGNCALYSMGNINRDDLRNNLQELLTSRDVRIAHFLALEIQDALESGQFYDEGNEYGLLKQRRDIFQQAFESKQAELQSKYPRMFEENSIEDKLRSATSLGEKEPLAQAFITNWRRWQEQENKIKSHLSNQSITERYINALGEDGCWIGWRSLILYAHRNNIRLRIWQQSADGLLTLMARYPNNLNLDEVDCRDILYRNGNHFVALQRIAHPANTDIRAPVGHQSVFGRGTPTTSQPAARRRRGHAESEPDSQRFQSRQRRH